MKGVWIVVSNVVDLFSFGQASKKVSGQAGCLQDAEMRFKALIQANYKRQAKGVIGLPCVVIDHGFAATLLCKAPGNVNYSTVVEANDTVDMVEGEFVVFH